MVEFQHVGTFQTGYTANVTDLTLAEIGGRLMLFSATHVRGGLSAFSITAPHQVALHAGSYKYAPSLLHMAEPEAVVIARPEGSTVIGAGLWSGADQARVVAPDGALAQGDAGLARAALPHDLLTAHGFQTASGLSLMVVSRHENPRFAIWKQLPDGSLAWLSGSEPPPGLPGRAQIDSVCAFRLGGVDLIATASTRGNFVALHRVLPDGTLAAGEFLSSAVGTGFDGPRQLAFIEVDGRPFLIVNGAGSSSLTVLPGGGLLPVEHVLDELTTRFEGATEMATVTVAGRSFVIAGGADDGLSLFTVTPAGS